MSRREIHGTTAQHNAGCRCEPCCAAKLRYDKVRKYEVGAGKPRTVPIYRAARRVQALQCMGYSGRVIADLMGVHRQVVFDMAWRRERVYLATFEKLREVYDAHCMTPATGPKVTRVKREAARKNYLPPLAWDDIDDPDERPSEWRYQSANRAEMLDDLIARGDGISAALSSLDVTRKALERWCERNGKRDLFVQLVDREYVKTEYRNQFSREAS